MSFLLEKGSEQTVQTFITSYGSIISVVGKTTVEIMELFQCTQKVP